MKTMTNQSHKQMSLALVLETFATYIADVSLFLWCDAKGCVIIILTRQSQGEADEI